MADYIKPFIKDKSKTETLKDKFDKKDEDKQKVIAGMGDFDYESFPLVPVQSSSETDHLDTFSNKTKSILINIDNEIANNLQEQKFLGSKLDTIERELQKRKLLYEMCVAMCKEGTMEIEKYSEKNRKIDSSINYLEQMIDSWQCLIDQFRKIPDESDSV